METLNRFEIDEKIKNDLKNICTPEALRELQIWAKKAKKQKVVEPKVTSFKKIYYSYSSPVRSQGSGKKLYDRNTTVQATSFVFMGLEVLIEKDNNKKYDFPETLFNSKKIWIDNKIKWGGVEYFPKEDMVEYLGIDFMALFFDYLISKDFFVYENENYTGKKCCYLLDSIDNAKRLYNGRRLRIFDTCNHPVVKINKEQVIFLIQKIPFKTSLILFPTSNEPINW